MAEQGQKATESRKGEIGFLAGRELLSTFAPFFVASSIEALWHDGVLPAMWAGTDEFFSGQALSYEPSNYAKLQITQDAASVAKYDKVWDDLSPAQQKYIEFTTPEIKSLEKKIEAEKSPSEEINRKEQIDAGKNVRRMLPRETQMLLRSSGVRIKGVPRRVGNYWLNNERYEDLQDQIAQDTEMLLSKIDIDRIPIKDRQVALEKIVDKAREIARKKVIVETYK
jgi:hypothetical protein